MDHNAEQSRIRRRRAGNERPSAIEEYALRKRIILLKDELSYWKNRLQPVYNELESLYAQLPPHRNWPQHLGPMPREYLDLSDADLEAILEALDIGSAW